MEVYIRKKKLNLIKKKNKKTHITIYKIRFR